MKFGEIEIQKFIWEHRDELWDRIEKPIFEEITKKEPGRYEPWELLFHKTLDKYRSFYQSLEDMNILGWEVRLPKENESTIRADFLGDFDGENGLVICELKVNKEPERQAYTEMLAYANHIRNAFVPMGRQDIFYLLISPMEERIVREATLHSLIYDNNRVVALIPKVGETIDTLRFDLWIPNKKDFKTLTKTIFASENIETFKVCWRGVGKWSPSKKGESPDERMIHQLNQVSAYAAQLMEANGINGFVFCSQSYPEIREYGFMENSITICGINPFKATKTKLLYEHGASLKDASNTSVEYISLLNIFPSLKKNSEEANKKYNHWEVMSMVWSSCIERIAFEVQERLTQGLGSSVDRDRGGMSWEDYLNNSDEDKGCWNYDIRLTGILRDLYDLHLQSYFDCVKSCSKELSVKFADLYGLQEHYIDMLNSQAYVRDFLIRLVEDGEDDFIENPIDDNDLIIHEYEQDV